MDVSMIILTVYDFSLKTDLSLHIGYSHIGYDSCA